MAGAKKYQQTSGKYGFDYVMDYEALGGLPPRPRLATLSR